MVSPEILTGFDVPVVALTNDAAAFVVLSETTSPFTTPLNAAVPLFRSDVALVLPS